MKSLAGFLACSMVFAASLAGCVASRVKAPSDVPPALQPPAGQVLLLALPAQGVQIYQCIFNTNKSGAFEWTFKAPEAQLFDQAGHPAGKHYAGPTWQLTDGSSVVGELQVRYPSPDPSAIPWLLLGVKSTTGTSVLSKVSSIQRLRTVGGNAPAEPCTAEQLQQLVRVPYSATYYFYGAKS